MKMIESKLIKEHPDPLRVNGLISDSRCHLNGKKISYQRNLQRKIISQMKCVSENIGAPKKGEFQGFTFSGIYLKHAWNSGKRILKTCLVI